MSANVVATQEIHENPHFWDKIKDMFHKEEVVETPVYHRKLLDGRIERYMDENFEDYIAEYSLVTEADINASESRFEVLKVNVGALLEFSRDIDAKTTDLERRVKKIDTASKSKPKVADTQKK